MRQRFAGGANLVGWAFSALPARLWRDESAVDLSMQMPDHESLGFDGWE